MMLQIWEIRQALRNSEKINSIDVSKDILNQIEVMSKKLKPCSRKDIAVCIEIIASTFSINIPNEVGLEQYFKILQKYPAQLLAECTDDIIKTFQYPRLPLPKEFIDRMDTNFEYHKGWLQKICEDIYKLEIKKQNANINITKE